MQTTTLTDEQIIAIRDQVGERYNSAAHVSASGAIEFARAILAAVPAQPTQPQPECKWPNCMSEKAQQDLAAEIALETFGVAAQPQQVEGAAPTQPQGQNNTVIEELNAEFRARNWSIRPSAEPAGQRDAGGMVNLRYKMYPAYDSGENRHPQAVMKDLGITYQHATPQSMGDQWWFWDCENVPAELPTFLEALGLSPRDAVGFGLSQEVADKLSPQGQPEGCELPRPAAYGIKSKDGFDPLDGHKQLIGVSVQPCGSHMKAQEVALFTADQVRACIDAALAARQAPADIRDKFEAWYAPLFAGGAIANMPRRTNGEYVRAQTQIAWMAYQVASEK